MQQLVLFLTVVENPGITMPELVDLLGMPQGTVSRNVKALSHYVVWQDGVAVPHGRNLLRTQADEDNRHVLAVYPTGRGEALAREIAQGALGRRRRAGWAARRASGGRRSRRFRHWPRH